MTNPHEVYENNEKWAEIWILFDDGKYSVISGAYMGTPERRLAERWNGSSKDDRPLGFPINEKGQSAWFLVPEFLEIPLLHALLNEVLKHPNIQQIRVSDPAKYIVTELKNKSRRVATKN